MNKALYGTRDAPQAWAKLVKDFMVQRGFDSSPLSPGVYYHSSRNLRIITHVDFLVTGEKCAVQWFIGEVSSMFEVKTPMLGWDRADVEPED